MRDPLPTTVYLKDYTPPKFLISTIDLDIDLREDAARVRAKLAIKRNGAHNEALILNGDALELESVALDGRALKPGRYALDATQLSIAEVPDAFMLETTVRIEPQKNT